MKSRSKRAAPGGGLKVFEPVRVRLDDCKFAKYNPRVMPPDKREALERSIEEHGVVATLALQKSSNTVIAGHQRIDAIRAVCRRNDWPVPEEVWAYVLDVDDRTAKRLNVALNNVEGEFDPLRLSELLRSVNDESPLADGEVLGMGLDLKDLPQLLTIGEPPSEDAGGPTPGPRSRTTPGASPELKIEFATESERDEARDALAEMVRRDRSKKPGAFVLAAIRALRGAG